jgi:hypothetical protein
VANPEHVEIVRQGAEATARWREEHPDESLDLSEVDLSGLDLSKSVLFKANLRRANLRKANLSDAMLGIADLDHATLERASLSNAKFFSASLMDANLIGVEAVAANFRGAFLVGADLTEADLLQADLALANLTLTKLDRTNVDEANLSGTNFMGTSLNGAMFKGAKCSNSIFAFCDLHQAKHLEYVVHEISSSIGIDTLIRSFQGAGDRLTEELESFFLGAGVPKELLDEIPRIVAEIPYFTCFICYGEPDHALAEKLRNDLVGKGVSCWFYPKDYIVGEDTWPEIDAERNKADKVLVICSARSLLRDGALKEIERQMDEEPNKIVPVSLDNIWTQDGFRVMRGSQDFGPWLRNRKNRADFSDPSKYEESLDRLLKGLERNQS